MPCWRRAKPSARRSTRSLTWWGCCACAADSSWPPARRSRLERSLEEGTRRRRVAGPRRTALEAAEARLARAAPAIDGGAAYCSMTSAPGGTVKRNAPARSARWRRTREPQQRVLAEAVDDLERGEVLALKADADRLERAVLRLRLAPRPSRDRPSAAGRRGRSRCSSEPPASSAAGVAPSAWPKLARADLVQVGVVDPDLLAVGDDRLLERLRVGEAEAVRPRELEAAARRLLLRAVGRGDRLRELRAAGLHVAHEVAQRVDRIGARRHSARQSAARPRRGARARDHSARAGTRMSRLPLVRHAGYESGFLHLFQQSRGAVVADAQVALDQRDRRAAVLQHDADRLVVHRVVLAVAAAGLAAGASPPSPSSVPPSRMPSM